MRLLPLNSVCPLMFVLIWAMCGTMETHAQVTQPLVAVHDSELTRALENMPASGATPTNSGTTGKQWWVTDWHYFVMPESVKEALRSDGTAFTVIGDSNISSGILLTNGQPRFPIVITLASEAIRDDEIAPFTNYVAAGGFLFVGSSSFSRNTNGTTRGDFALANQMGVHAVSSSLQNWSQNANVTKLLDHRIDAHVPNGNLEWIMPAYSDEIPWGVSPTHYFEYPHDTWRVNASDATVLLQGDSNPFLTVKPYGKGCFIYCAAFQPLIGNFGFAPSTQAYVILRRSIEWAFESLGAPLVKLSPWPYQYDAAYMVRHDLENFTNEVAAIDASAQVEFSYGAKGDYYFCTGTLRDDAAPGGYNTNAIILGLRHAVTNYGATIGPHNGGLKNPVDNTLQRGDYNYWHWGTDEALDTTPPGYPNGKAYATASLSNAFHDVETWLAGTPNGSGLRPWVQCYFNGTREDSYDLQNRLGVKIAGDQKLSPFPHWTLSTVTPNKRYPFLSEPVSDWFIVDPNTMKGLVAQALDPYPPPTIQTTNTMRAGIDFYYNLGALINFYSHTLSSGLGPAWGLTGEYVAYCANTNLHPRVWPANAVLVYQWWLQRSNVLVNASYSTNGSQTLVNLAVSGSVSTNTAVEVSVPATISPCGIQVFTNGIAAGNAAYRVVNGQIIRVNVGTSVTNVAIGYYPSITTLAFSENFDGVAAPALPSGWSTSASGAQTNWVTRTGTNNTPPNCVFAADPTNVGVSELVSPPIALPAGAGVLTFSHFYDLEADPDIGYDGGVLEIKIGTNAFSDILQAGGSFATNGYNLSISSDFSNPLAGRAAWSGNSGGFVQTVVNLPLSASGKTVQFKWRCASDNSNGKSGWRVDSVSLSDRVCLCCVTSNNPPTFVANPSDVSIPELTPLTVPDPATDLNDGPLYYTLVDPPAGAGISSAGVISWTPSEDQGPGTYTITAIVSDGIANATNSFHVTDTEVNSTPAFISIPSDLSVVPSTPLSVTNSASDSDIPANALRYSLLSSPAGMTINTNTGVISWTPSAGQNHTTNAIRTVVTDDGSPSLSATNMFTIVVDGNPAIVLDSATLVQEHCLSTNNAIDPGETVTVLFAVRNVGWGDSINLTATLLQTNGVVAPSAPQSYGVVVAGGAPVIQPFTFANTGACGGTITAVLQLQDGPKDLGTVSASFNLGALTVISQNFDGTNAPNLPTGWTTSASGAQPPWYATNTVADTSPNAAFSVDAGDVGINELDSPPIALPNGPAILSFRHRYSFEANPSVATNGYDGGVLEIKIGTNAFTDITNGGSWIANGYNCRIDPGYSNPLTNRWAWSGTNSSYITSSVNLPSAASGQTVQLRWRAGTDNGNGGGGWRIDTVTITGYACCVNGAPLLPTQTNLVVPELTLLSVTNTASDASSGPLIYTLVNPPVGASIDANGIISWTPSEDQGPGVYTITTVVSDDAYPPLRATNSFNVSVAEVNTAPVLTIPGNQMISELTALNVSTSATDSDIPTNTLTFSLISAPSGMTINPNTGAIAWTPTEAQGPSTNTVTVRVTDDGVPNLSDTKSFTVVVNELNTAPVLTVPGIQMIGELTALNVSASATDSDIPTNTLTFSLVSAPSGMTINPNAGAIAWTPTEAQGPSTNTVTVRVTDDGVPNLSDTKSFIVVVNELNTAPVMIVPTNQIVDELTTLNVSVSATDGDIPTNTIVFALLAPPDGMTIQTNTGAISWTPTEAQGPSTNTVMVVATDNGEPPLSVTNSFTVIVNEVNCAPVLPAQSDITLHSSAALTVTNTATDSDLPANQLAYTLLGGPAGAVIDTNGVITWTHTPSSSLIASDFIIVVTDNGIPPLSATNHFAVTVIPPAGPPLILSINLTNGVATVAWASVAGHTYQLEYKDRLTDTDWTPILPAINASDSTTTATNAVGSKLQRFYRVSLLPE